MERIITEHSGRGDSVIGGYVIPRPSALTNGRALGGSKVRVGEEAKPAVGYTISRDDVGLWMFEHLVRGGGRMWAGKKPTLTY